MDAKTSETHPIEVGWLESDGPGRVGLTFAPGKRQDDAMSGRWERSLAADLAWLREHHGVDVLVCLVEDRELAALQIAEYPDEAVRRGFTFHRLPIRDGGVPSDTRRVRATLDAMSAAFDAGQTVVVHCKGGLGRAGTVAGCWLRSRGVEAAETLRRLIAARGESCPENGQQRLYIKRWEASAPR